MKPRFLWTTLLLLGAGMSGCEDGRQVPPNARASFIHAAPSQGPIDVRRGESLEAELNYKDSVTTLFNVDVYNFHFEITPAGTTEAERPVSFTHEMVAATDYTFVATEIDGQFQQLVLETPSFDSDSTNVQLASLHVAPTLGAVDIFLEAPDADILSAIPLGTLSFTEALAPRTVDAGVYEFIVTEAANPSSVLLRSIAFTLSAGASVLFSVIDGTNEGLAPLAITASGDATASFVDRNLQSGVRVISAVSDRSTLDVGIDAEFSPPLFPGLTFGTVSDYTLIEPGTHNLTASPAGNPSVLTVDFPFTATAGALGTFFIANAAGAPTLTFPIDDTRPIAGEAKLSIYNAAQLFVSVDAFIAPPGTDLGTILPTSGLSPGGTTSGIPLVTGDFELTIRGGGTNNVLAGPTPITLVAGGFYGILITDSVGGATVDVALLDDFN